ncbi:MAG: hypothetical protein KJN94_09865, partial [Gammaproteobacteria bacterium]|nr:hypothetical protein [Gammaproteobacteria bacterium]
MELTDKLKDSVRISKKKRADTRLVIALGVFGLLIFLMAAWPRFTDWRAQRQVAAAQAEGREFVDQLAAPIQALKSVLTDGQVQELALRALENPEQLDDLSAY